MWDKKKKVFSKGRVTQNFLLTSDAPWSLSPLLLQTWRRIGILKMKHLLSTSSIFNTGSDLSTSSSLCEFWISHWVMLFPLVRFFLSSSVYDLFQVSTLPIFPWTSSKPQLQECHGPSCKQGDQNHYQKWFKGLGCWCFGMGLWSLVQTFLLLSASFILCFAFVHLVNR